MTELANRFDLQRTLKKDTSHQTQEVPKELLERATEIVVKAMTEFDGTSSEIETHNRLLGLCAAGDKSAQAYVKMQIKKIIERDHNLAQPPLSDLLVKQIYEDRYGLGPIEDLFNDPTINEIWVNGAEHIWIERGGVKSRVTDRRIASDEDVKRIIHLLLQFDRKELTATEPKGEARMMDGSRLAVSIPPVSKRPYINIRKFNAFDVTTENLLAANTLDEKMVDWLQKAVRGRANILIIGETSAGKTSFLKWLVSLMNPNLRLGTIESVFELKIDEKFPERNIFSLEEHEELGLDMGELFKMCLRYSPDIIIVGEARGKESDQLIRAMRRGHPGSIGTIHTNEPETAIDDLAEMINEDGKRRDPIQLRHRIASSLNLIIQLRRFEDTGIRRVTRITEVIASQDSYEYKLQDIFRFQRDESRPEAGRFEKVSSISKGLRNKLINFGVVEKEAEAM